MVELLRGGMEHVAVHPTLKGRIATPSSPLECHLERRTNQGPAPTGSNRRLSSDRADSTVI
jgi:hypothetical protein